MSSRTRYGGVWSVAVARIAHAVMVARLLAVMRLLAVLLRSLSRFRHCYLRPDRVRAYR